MISIIVSLIFLGVGLYLVSLIPMPDWVKQVITVVAILFVVIFLLDAFGLMHLSIKRLK